MQVLRHLHIFAEQLFFTNTFHMQQNATRDGYHADTSRISKSGLDLLNRSPIHYWAKYLSPDRPTEESKKHFVLGSITNDVLLQQHLLDDQYCIVPDNAPRRPSSAQVGAKKPSDETLAAIAWWDEFNAKVGGKQVVEAKDYDAACRMRDAVWSHPAAALLLNKGIAEKTHYFREAETGAPCKFRPDFEATDLNFLVDLKTTADASPSGFGRSAMNYRYHVQAAFYSDGFFFAHGQYPKGFAFIAVEKEYPYCVAVYYADERTMELGHNAYMDNLRLYMECREKGEWPGYSLKIEPLRMPEFAFKQL